MASRESPVSPTTSDFLACARTTCARSARTDCCCSAVPCDDGDACGEKARQANASWLRSALASSCSAKWCKPNGVYKPLDGSISDKAWDAASSRRARKNVESLRNSPSTSSGRWQYSQAPAAYAAVRDCSVACAEEMITIGVA